MYLSLAVTFARAHAFDAVLFVQSNENSFHRKFQMTSSSSLLRRTVDVVVVVILLLFLLFLFFFLIKFRIWYSFREHYITLFQCVFVFVRFLPFLDYCRRCRQMHCRAKLRKWITNSLRTTPKTIAKLSFFSRFIFVFCLLSYKIEAVALL